MLKNLTANSEVIKKCVRLFIVAFSFLCLLTVKGMDTRHAHEIVYVMGTMVITAILLENIWLTLFMWWTAFLFVLYKFSCGQLYLQYIFCGCILYYLTKKSFKVEHINFFIRGILILLALNCLYMIPQVIGKDWLWEALPFAESGIPKSWNLYQVFGFMGCKAFMGCFVALCIPLLATRHFKGKWILTALLLIPLYLSKSSICIAASIIGIMFVLWFYIKRWVWLAISSLLIIGGLLYFFVEDKDDQRCFQSAQFRMDQWQLTLKDAFLHPVAGWGLDSFRNITKQKQHIYAQMVPENVPGQKQATTWDNPHNLYISLIFEFGIFSWLFLAGYLRQIGIWFKNSIKSSNTIALTGFLLVFLIVSMAQFPIFLGRFAVIIIPALALLEVQLRGDKPCVI